MKFSAALFAAAACLTVLTSKPVQADGPSLTGDRIGNLIVHPIRHGTLALGWQDKVIYVDPVGGAGAFEGLPRPDLILITDIHGDHLNAETVAAVKTDGTRIIAPAAVADKLSEQVQVLGNGKQTTVSGIQIEAIPMYNLTPERKRYHTKGRGNGYVLTLGKQRVYISGDTEDIPEMRALKDIDVAFVCMNLPYTMTVEQAADGVLGFRPKVVYPYHYRGSDTEKFKKLVSKEPSIEVRLRDWYR